MDYQAIYAEKLRTAEEAVKPVPFRRHWIQRWQNAAESCTM